MANYFHILSSAGRAWSGFTACLRHKKPKQSDNGRDDGSSPYHIYSSPQNTGHSGRSMVEMLGVLAIIGVLSVGGIAGYQQAMFKHKMNAFSSGISFVMNQLETVISRNNHDTGYVTSLLIKLDMVPEGFFVNEREQIIHPFGGEFYVRTSIGVPSQKAYAVYETNGISVPVCLNFFTSGDWYHENLLYAGVSNTNIEDENSSGKLYHLNSVDYLNDKDKIAEICQKYCSDNNCRIQIEKYLIFS